MGTFYTDEQIQETIAALESYSPGIWEIMKKMALVADPFAEGHGQEHSAIVRALTVVLPKMSFVKQAGNKLDAENRLLIDVRRAVRAELDEPPRVCRRLFGLSYAATAGCSSMA